MSETEIESLWPDDLVNGDLISPEKILRDQASLLPKLTHGLINAEILFSDEHSPHCLYTFVLVAPKLEGYRYELFSLRHGFAFYPCVFIDNTTSETSLFDTELAEQEQLINHLRSFFNDPAPRGIIQTLVAKSIGRVGK